MRGLIFALTVLTLFTTNACSSEGEIGEAPVPTDLVLKKGVKYKKDFYDTTGVLPWRTQGLMELLDEDGWQKISSCTQLRYRTDDGKIVVPMAVTVTGAPVDLACEMEKQGHEVTHHMLVSNPLTPTDKLRAFYKVKLDSGEKVILERAGIHRTITETQGEETLLYLNGVYQRTFAEKTGRGFNERGRDKSKNFGTARQSIAGFLLGTEQFNLVDIGILPKGGDLGPPSQRDVARAVVRGVQRLYGPPTSYGFSSSITMLPGVPVTVNFRGFEELECEKAKKLAYDCSFIVKTFARTSNARTNTRYFRAGDSEVGMTGQRIRFDKKVGDWMWETKDAAVHVLVPTEFRQ